MSSISSELCGVIVDRILIILSLVCSPSISFRPRSFQRLLYLSHPSSLILRSLFSVVTAETCFSTTDTFSFLDFFEVEIQTLFSLNLELKLPTTEVRLLAALKMAA